MLKLERTTTKITFQETNKGIDRLIMFVPIFNKIRSLSLFMDKTESNKF